MKHHLWNWPTSQIKQCVYDQFPRCLFWKIKIKIRRTYRDRSSVFVRRAEYFYARDTLLKQTTGKIRRRCNEKYCKWKRGGKKTEKSRLWTKIEIKREILQRNNTGRVDVAQIVPEWERTRVSKFFTVREHVFACGKLQAARSRVSLVIKFATVRAGIATAER